MDGCSPGDAERRAKRRKIELRIELRALNKVAPKKGTVHPRSLFSLYRKEKERLQAEYERHGVHALTAGGVRTAKTTSAAPTRQAHQTTPPPVPPTPAIPDMMNRRPRRARPPADSTLFAGKRALCHGQVGRKRHMTHLKVQQLPLKPSLNEGTECPRHGLSKKRASHPLTGFVYGPKNTCAVDTFLTLIHHALTPREKLLLKQMASTTSDHRGDPPREHHLGRTAAARALFAALHALSEGDDSVAAKRHWYEFLNRPSSAAGDAKVRGSHGRGGRDSARRDRIDCTCRCPCALCEGGQCLKCSRCKCKRSWLIGHCFGVMEQFFSHLLPPSHVASSPFGFTTRQRWQCGAHSSCGYAFHASQRTEHVPLLLSARDISELLAVGIAPEVGALLAAHLSANAYDYGPCPQCARGPLRARAIEPHYPPLILVEVGREDGGVGGDAAGDLDWFPRVSPTITLRVREGASSGEALPQEYQTAAVMYNDGSHWWADLMSPGHFRSDKPASGKATHAGHGAEGDDAAALAAVAEPRGFASYRYDGLEASGRLRFCGYSLELTSDPRHISAVLYRRRDGSPKETQQEGWPKAPRQSPQQSPHQSPQQTALGNNGGPPRPPVESERSLTKGERKRAKKRALQMDAV